MAGRGRARRRGATCCAWPAPWPRPRFSRPRLAAAQTFTATTISQAAQDARRDAGRLGLRADNLLRLTVADGPERGASAVRRFRAEQVSLARDLAAIFNSRVSEDDWLLVVPTRELDLALTMQPLVIRLAPTPDEVEAASGSRCRRSSRSPATRAEDVLLTIVLGALGLPRHVALFEQLRERPRRWRPPPRTPRRR